MIIVCSNCGQNMEGTPDLLHTEVRCPNCLEWVYPQLPKAGLAARPTAGSEARRPPQPAGRPEEMGQARLDELVGANEKTGTRHSRRHRKSTRDLWYVLTNSGPAGPYDKEQIIGFARDGKINKANQLRNATSGTEYRAGEVPDLFPSRGEPAEKPKLSNESEWYVKTARGQAGPFTGAELVAFAKSGKINAGTMLRKGQVGDFTAAEHIKGLFPANK
ncbi:MAG: DUF4339 domain-containing protein [Planctomycetes bacterium]|nr:DUF4339 domain-containing protein [Planctomycetota bacterium]